MEAAYSIKVAYQNQSGETESKTIGDLKVSMLDNHAVAFAKSISKVTSAPVTEAAKVVQTPLSLSWWMEQKITYAITARASNGSDRTISFASPNATITGETLTEMYEPWENAGLLISKGRYQTVTSADYDYVE